MDKRSCFTGVLICSTLCGMVLFVFSQRFVNAEVTPKWVGLMMIIGMIGVLWSIFKLEI